MNDLKFFEWCIVMKQPRHPFGKGDSQIKGMVDYINYDIWGPSQVELKGRSKYRITFMDDYLRKSYNHVLKSKSKMFNHFK